MAALSKDRQEQPDGRVCFVISPIGPNDSDVRRRADQVLKYVLQEVLEPRGYSVVRADKIADAGRIDTQVLDHVAQAELVVADLTGSNPNVYYELAVRHALGKPFVQICQAGEKLPFDIQGLRTIFFDHTDLDSVAAAKAELDAAVTAVEQVDKVVTPLSISVDLATLRSSGDPSKRVEAQMLDFMVSVERRLASLGEALSPDGKARSDAATRRHREAALRQGQTELARKDHLVELVKLALTESGYDSWSYSVAANGLSFTVPAANGRRFDEPLQEMIGQVAASEGIGVRIVDETGKLVEGFAPF